MADTYSTIQQHQPLRVPQGWDKQEKALIVQLDEIFDDIYRRFGRLRMEDMGKAFRKQIKDDEGNIADLIVDVGQIEVKVRDKYDIVSGITINTNGIALSGSKYIDIASGCYIDIKSGGTIEIESGGDLNIKSGGALKIKSGGGIDVESGGNLNVKSGGSFDIRTGGTFSLQSGNFDIDSSGNVSFKGGAEILSGKSLKIKSGGNLDIESGSSMSVKTGGTFSLQSGNFSVDSSGNVALKGGVEITSGKDLTVKSGGNFTVDAGGSAIFNSNRFYVDSTNLYISSYSGNLAIYGTYPLYNITTGYAIGNRATKSCDFESWSDPHQIFVGSGAEQTAYYNLRNGIVDKATNSRYDEEMEYTYGVLKEIDKDTETNTLMYEFCINGRTWDRTAEEYIVRPSLLDVYCVHYHNYIWGPRAYISNIYYGHMYQNSSRDIKHDIEPLEPVGTKLDLLKPVTFVYDDDESEQTRMGLIYEDSIEIMPEICTQDEGKKAINYVELIPALLKEIQDLRKRVSELEERG